ncbi:hypothetical protein [Pusillimonas sp. ANT_WB101]|uniref:hypothetical protein n=1 Tax=Pusillimonas sp. ANT_WB101 TaxID=2597356 RepID=UPI0011EC0ACD|nr:hypothetical protein [Pusillimonas sp. ANT_WB101]KAA0911323.1 hypothetical protein FQ179_05640 [Pusillimonas sp. ANT_WB101]
MNLRSELLGKHALASKRHGLLGLVGGISVHALTHFLAGVLIAAFLLPESALVTLLGLVTIVAMRTLYRFLDQGQLTASDACNAGLLLLGGVLCLLYGLII